MFLNPQVQAHLQQGRSHQPQGQATQQSTNGQQLFSQHLYKASAPSHQTHPQQSQNNPYSLAAPNMCNLLSNGFSNNMHPTLPFSHRLANDILENNSNHNSVFSVHAHDLQHYMSNHLHQQSLSQEQVAYSEDGDQLQHQSHIFSYLSSIPHDMLASP